MTTTFGKLTIAALIAGSTLIAGTAEAATKEETQATVQFEALKPGMTMEQVAKVLYGKSYKTQLTKKDGSTMLKKKPEFSDKEDGQKFVAYDFHDTKVKVAPTYTSLSFVTKSKDSVYRLTSRMIEVTAKTKLGVRESKMQLTKGAKLTEGMTEKQLDAVLTGKGLGEWMDWGHFDYSTVASKADIKLGLADPVMMKSYVFQTTDPKKRMVVSMDYNFKKKIYEVFMYEKVSAMESLL
ncbi:hypothetical protein BLD48_08725 [Exiguobacterium sp. KRL4]|uniref:hypothetical protein n=1 Tax=Exiguobacterium TaxID=33986 RepID=UPI00047EF8D3|nr:MULTISPECIES: hypothetical protein [Exiguobacterium]OIN66792.1 hypothetical protein BLD48_08725 [Exiguobacterium sp. KRL4]